MRTPLSLIVLVVAAATVTGAQSQEGFRFKSGVEFVNVTATVTNNDGRFVSGLKQEDFTVYEDGQLQEVSHFSADRVPVSLGIALDASGSMSPEKLAAARAAIERSATFCCPPPAATRSPSPASPWLPACGPVYLG